MKVYDFTWTDLSQRPWTVFDAKRIDQWVVAKIVFCLYPTLVWC